VQYADWAAWQRAWLADGELDRQLAHWTEELDGLPPLSLPTDRPRPARPEARGDSLPVRLEADLVARLERLARREGATLHMTLLAAFATVLSRWSGQDDFGIGTPVANRTREEAESLIGLFVNSLVVRARLHGRDLTFRDLLARLRETSLRAYAHQDVPFDRVVEAVAPDRDLSRTPLFQTMFILQNAPVRRLDLGGLELEPFAAPTGTSTFDLTLSLEPPGERFLEGPADAGAVVGDIEYSTELFDEATMRRLWSHLVRVLESVAADPEARVRTLALLDDAERTRALHDWSGRSAIVGPGPTVPERIAAAARAHPDRVAAVLGERRMTYGELDERSDRLAARLRGLGVGAEDRVALHLERSPELLVAILAAWKSGAAYVPLDPQHPQDRVAAAISDAGARVVVTAPGRSSPRPDLPSVSLGADDLPDDDADASPFAWTPPAPASVAYVIYTSGTTGLPKGVMIPHDALARAYVAWESLYSLPSIGSHLQMANVAFDVCTGDVVRALASGGTLVFCDRDTLLDPAALLALARRERPEFAEFVPAVLRPLAAHARRVGARLDSFRTVAVGSDVWSASEVPTFRALFGPETRIANSYGVTEATIDSTCWFLGDGDRVGAHPPIGRPLAHATVHVLDEALEPTPPGVLGELYLGGPSVARGYLGRPDLTADRFVPDPFGPPGSRLYRTGDRARCLADGRFVFAGRGDDQVKVRGQRVELAEIETALAAAPGVDSGVVVVRGEGPAARLAAYVVPPPGATFDVDRARRAMREALPEAWIPAAFVVLDAIPLTPNGKVDRRRLPEPEWTAAAFEEPSGEQERVVAATYASALGVDRVGAGDDFFALGGHSLLAVQVTSRLRRELGVEVPVRTLFEHPAVRDLAAALTAADASSPPPVTPAGAAERRPLSFAQQRLWFLERLEPGTAAYHLPTRLDLEGSLDVPALEQALSDLVDRHEALRTRFVDGPDGPEQHVAPSAPLPLDLVDLTRRPPDRRKAARDEHAREEVRRPFDLETAPLLRATLYRLDETHHSLLVTTHHICSDGWSLVVLVKELAELYAAHRSGAPAPLPPLPVQYADWSAWQRAWLGGGELDRQLDHWREALRGVPALALPFDRPRPVRPTHAGDSLDVRIPGALRARLESLAREEGATLHMALLAVYGATLARWSGQDRFAVGTPVANRRTAEAEGLIGFFVNTLALPLHVDGDALTFRELLGRVRRTALGAHSHQDVPFERVVEELDPERHRGHHPLFQVLFALQNVPVDRIELPGLQVTYDEPGTGSTRFDVELFLAETERVEAALPGASVAEAGDLEGLLNYSTELFDRVTMERFLESLIAGLDAVTARPDVPLRELPALTASQRRRVLHDWNAPRALGEAGALVHDAFERQAADHPDALAARFGEETISYGELDARANRLAQRLRRHGAGAEGAVAVALERSIGLVVALLAVVKSGAAYVPVDPEYPADRIELLLADSRATLLLTSDAVTDRLPQLPGVIRLRPETDAADDADVPEPAPHPSPDAPAFLVYTSGSTGRPKGVAMTHRALGNLLAWQTRASGAPLRTLQFAALSFDVSFQEIFSTLSVGAEIVLVTEEERRDPAALLRLVDRFDVQRLFLPFVALQQLAETAVEEDRFPAGLREINAAGEQLKVTPALRTFFSRLGACRLVNQYGPAETHVVTAGEVEGDPADWPSLPAIGRPVPGAPVYLLDDRGRPVPIGTPGELYAGGAAPARGYHRRPDLTAERFVPDPFSDVPGARLYRTGDVARFRSDGTLEFLGRRDRQIKVRGYRVEPGEIEAELARHPAVRQAAVRDHDHPGGRRLAAYVTLRAGASAGPDVLRAHLAGRLPEFLVPAAIVPLDALPLSPSGKVDRDALPEPDWAPEADLSTPRAPEEEIVAAIFAEVLDLPSAGIHDDFFALGGHSLLATRVMSRVRRSFATEVPLRALFEAPTPARLAAEVRAARGVPALPPVTPAAEADRWPLSPAQHRLWFLDRLDPGQATYNIPAAVRLAGPLDVSALERSLSRVVYRHETLRTRFPEGPHGPEQRVEPAAGVSLIPESPRDDVDASAWCTDVLAGEAAAPFDLARGPVLRVRLLRLAPETHVLSLVVHHIAADGASLRILWNELADGYEAAVAGREPDAVRPPVQYADWAAWQRSWLEGGELDRQLAHWRSALDGAPPALELPTDRARPERATTNGATRDVHIASELSERIGAFARAEGATRHMVLLAAWAWTLLRASGQDEVVVGTPVANRRTDEAEALIGFFVNTLPVRIAGGRTVTFRDLLARVRSASLDAYANQDVPFERIVEELQPDRALHRAPVFQTAFALQDLTFESRDTGGLRWQPLDADNDTAKFDVMLLLGDDDEGISGALEYNVDLFDRSTMDRLADRFHAALEWGLSRPDSALSGVPPDPSEADRLHVLATGPERTFPGPSLLPARFEAAVDRAPEATACLVAGQPVSYFDLEQRANRLANHLRRLGAGPEVRVATVLERSVAALEAMLGILKAGAAWVPLDPADPPERRSAALADCGAGFVITEDRFLDRLPAAATPGADGGDGSPPTIVALDRDAAALAAASADRPPTTAAPGNLAYLVYTSGSTGRPKAVAVEHRQISNYLDAAIEALGIEPGWRFAWISTIAADLGHTALFPALTTGGSLLVIPAELALDAPGLETTLLAHPVDAMKIVPSHLSALLSGARPEAILPRRLLVLGGEATSGALLATLREKAPRLRVANHYGPTETTVGAVAGDAAPDDEARPTVPLGRPLANTSARILDETFRPAPAGTPGELYLAGAGVARGYLGRPDLTAERFLPDPAGAPGARMYRTGDRARWLSDGRLEFLGRTDDQVKVRGFRVEPGEIAATVQRHPGVRAAAVVVRDDPGGGRSLAAYVVAQPRNAPVVHGQPRRALPSGLAMAELNRNETDYLHREVVELAAYVRHGLTLRDGDTIFDVGANIGMFSVFASLACRAPRLVALEPNPRLHELLRANLAAYAPDASLFEVGAAEAEREAEFTFFPGFSLLSGLHADPATERDVVRSFVRNQADAGVEGAAEMAAAADTLLAERFAGERLPVRLRPLSDVIDETGTERIHFLKVNVEKSELAVLRGIRAGHWNRIDQAVVEVDVAEHLAEILELFESNGFDVLVDQDPLLDGTELCYVHAVRRGSGRVLSPKAPPSVRVQGPDRPLLTAEELRETLARTLPGAMLPSTWTFLESLPVTANGKLDRRRLPAPKVEAERYEAPRGEVQEVIAAVWAELLGRERVGAHDNFFDLGGHSLLLVRAHSALAARLPGSLTVVDLFRFPTVASLAAHVAGRGAGDAVDARAKDRGADRRAALRERAKRPTTRVRRTGAGD
jgi:amino acid adenylation domain-containing protein/FkbM family methyltransferase